MKNSEKNYEFPPLYPEFYFFPWRHRGWSHTFAFLHIGKIHFCFHRMGRSLDSGFWLPNISVTWL